MYLNPSQIRTCIASTEHIKSVVKLYLCNSGSRVKEGREGDTDGERREKDSGWADPSSGQRLTSGMGGREMGGTWCAQV